MRSRYSRLFQMLILLGDLFLLNLSFLVAGALRFDEIRIRETEYYDYYVQLVVFFNILWLLLNLLFRTYDIRRALEPRKATGKVVNAFFLHIFTLLLFLVVLKKAEYSRLFLIYFYSAFFVTVLPWRFYFLRFIKAMWRRGFSFRPVVLLGSGRQLQRFYQSIEQHPEYGLKVVAYYSDQPVAGIPLSGSEAELSAFVKSDQPEEIYCAFDNDPAAYARWFRFADDHLLRFRVVPDLGINHALTVDIDFVHDVPVLVHRKEPLEYMHNRLLKRAFDLTVAGLVMLLIMPWLLPLLAIGVKLSGKGPVFFAQRRTGLRDDPFSIYKFRSMEVNMHAHLQQATADDQRLTPFGRFIRRYNLDEFPQFFNVLKGEMSVVGPRPHMLVHTEEYRQLVDRFMVRHFARPGITGLAQVRGLRGELHSSADMEERVRTDVYYIENWSLLLDVKIVLLTLWQTLSGSRAKM